MRLLPLVPLLVVACGGQHTVPVTTKPTPVATGSDGGTPPAAATIDYTFSVGDPAIDVSAQVVDTTYGSITITTYPPEVTSNVRLAPITVGFSNFFDAGYCDAVRQQAQTALGNSFALQQLRGAGGVPIHLPLSPLSGSVFAGAAGDGARKAGAGGSSFEVTNPLTISGARLGVTVANDALVNIVGADALVAALVKTFNDSLATTVADNDFAVNVAAKDLLCDLKSGKVMLELTLSGQAGDVAWSGKTLSGAVVPY